MKNPFLNFQNPFTPSSPKQHQNPRFNTQQALGMKQNRMTSDEEVPYKPTFQQHGNIAMNGHTGHRHSPFLKERAMIERGFERERPVERLQTQTISNAHHAVKKGPSLLQSELGKMKTGNTNTMFESNQNQEIVTKRQTSHFHVPPVDCSKRTVPAVESHTLSHTDWSHTSSGKQNSVRQPFHSKRQQNYDWQQSNKLEDMMALISQKQPNTQHKKHFNAPPPKSKEQPTQSRIQSQTIKNDGMQSHIPQNPFNRKNPFSQNKQRTCTTGEKKQKQQTQVLQLKQRHVQSVVQSFSSQSSALSSTLPRKEQRQLSSNIPPSFPSSHQPRNERQFSITNPFSFQPRIKKELSSNVHSSFSSSQSRNQSQRELPNSFTSNFPSSHQPINQSHKELPTNNIPPSFPYSPHYTINHSHPEYQRPVKDSPTKIDIQRVGSEISFIDDLTQRSVLKTQYFDAQPSKGPLTDRLKKITESKCKHGDKRRFLFGEEGEVICHEVQYVNY